MPFLTPVFGMAFVFMLCYLVTMLHCYNVTPLCQPDDRREEGSREYKAWMHTRFFTTLRSVLNDNMFSFF